MKEYLVTYHLYHNVHNPTNTPVMEQRLKATDFEHVQRMVDMTAGFMSGQLDLTQEERAYYWCEVTCIEGGV